MKVFFKHITVLLLFTLMCGTVARAQVYVTKDTVILYQVKSLSSAPISTYSWMLDSVVFEGADSSSINVKWTGVEGAKHTLIATPYNGDCAGDSKSISAVVYTDTAVLPIHIDIAPIAEVCANPNGSATATINLTASPGSKAFSAYEGIYQVSYKIDNGSLITEPIDFYTDKIAELTVTKELSGDVVPLNHTLRIMKIVGIGLVQTYTNEKAPQINITVKKIPSIGEIGF